MSFNPFAKPTGNTPPPQNSGGGFNPFGQATVKPTISHQSGGFWGSVTGAVQKLLVKPVVNDWNAMKHEGYVSQQFVKAATTVGQIPTGLYNLGAAEGHIFKQVIEHPASKAPAQEQTAIAKQFVHQNVETIKHPARNLLNTALTVLPIASAGASAVARVGAAAAASGEIADAGSLARAGLVAKTLVKKPEMPIRILKVPGEQLKNPEGQYIGQEGVQGPQQLVRTKREVALATSKSPLSRAVQAAEDKFLQRGLDKSFENGTTTRLGKIAMGRVQGADSEVGRYTAAGRNVVAVQLERAKSIEGLTKPEASLAHFLRSANATPEEWANYARSQASDLAAAARGPVIKGKVKVRITDEEGKLVTTRVSVKAARQAATTHEQLAQVADSLAEKGVLKMSDGAVQFDRGKFPLTAQQSDLQAEAQATREGTILSNGLMNEEQLQARKDLVLRQMGITDRQGQGYTSLRSIRPARAPGIFARAVGKTLGRPQFSLGGKATGKSVRLGMIPADTLKGTALSLRASNKLQNTTDLRGILYGQGSDIRKSEDDWLVANPIGKQPEIPNDIKVLMGKAESTLTEAESKTLQQKWDNYVHDTLLRHAPSEEIGQAAPPGYRFVNKNLVPNALRESIGRGDVVGKYADVINSAVTSATVYTKLGHLPQRFLTNATTNFIQGGLNPVSLMRSWSLAKQLTDRQKLELEAFTGAHASQAPLIGATSQGRTIAVGRKLASGWARTVDAPFRLNSILYELRQIGYDTPEKISQAIEILKDPTRSGLSGSQIMKLDGAVRASNRAAIMYDGLNNFEKNSVSRYVWFYPWTKGALRFAGHTAAEHPFKAGILGQLGQQGASTTKKELGAFPTFESELTKLGGSKDFPIVANLSALTPYGTLSNTLDLASHPLGEEGVGSLLNPFLTGAAELAAGKGAGGFFSGTLSPTPEFQIGKAIVQPKDNLGKGFGNIFPTSSKNLFGQTWQSMLARAAIGGTAMPRKINRAKLNEYAAREHEKKRTITIWSKK